MSYRLEITVGEFYLVPFPGLSHIFISHVDFATDHLQQKIVKMESRMRVLEDALQVAQMQQSGEQHDQNGSGDVFNVQTTSLPITLAASDALAGASRQLDTLLAELESLDFSLPLKWLALAPGDPISLPLNGVPTRVRLT